MSEDDDDMDLAAAAIIWSGEFENRVEKALGDDPAAADFRVTGMVFDETRGLTILHAPVPAGFGPTDEQFVRHLDRPTMVNLLARTYRNRFRRLHLASGIVRPIAAGWRDVLKTHYPEMIPCSIDIGNGWGDLFFAMCAMIDETGETVRFTSISEKFAILHCYYDGEYRGTAAEIIRGAKFWSGDICEACGAPGEPAGIGWVRTLCPIHRAEDDAR